MNTSDKNLAIASTTIIHDPEKDGSTDVEAQRPGDQITSLDSNSISDGGSGDQLVGGPNPCTFLPHAPPTLWETAASVTFCVVGNTAAIVSLIFLDPHQRPMPTQYLEDSGEHVRNLTNNEIFKGETIPTLWLMFICVLLPGCIQALYSYCRGRPGDFLRTVNTYCVAFTLCSIATEFIKNYVGYLRPIFFDQCNPDEQYETCLGRYDEHDYFEVKELHKSFISGHSSFAFCGGVLFSYFLERTIGVSSVEVAVAQHRPEAVSGTTFVSMAYRKPPGLRKLGSILALTPMGVSIWVACSRLVDNVHFPADIVGGALLGGSIAVYCHPLWFPDPRYL